LNDNNIESQNTPIYTAKNNPIERFNRSLGEAFSICIMDYPNKQTIWVNFVEEIIKKLNSRRNEATHLPPIHVLYGFMPNPDEKHIMPLLDAGHFKIMKWAYKNSLRKFNYNQKYYNKDKSIRNFNIGDIVMVRIHTLSNALKKYNAKLDINFQPAIIIEKCFANAYKVKISNAKQIICDISDIKNISQDLQDILKETENFDN
jgi:hypothetical protein